MSFTVPPRIPFVIGVTGHRDIPPEDVAVLEAQVQSCLQRLKDEFPDTPLLILSGLAEGADRLVVRVAHAMGIQFASILPFNESSYIEDFDSEASRTEFTDWLSRAAWVHAFPDVNAHPAEIKGRQLGYVQLGNYLATYSQALLTLWDGQPQEKWGGTSQVVRLVLQGQRHDDPLPLKRPVTLERPVFHIATRRLSHANTPLEVSVGVLNTLWPTGFAETEREPIQQTWHDTLARLGQFNQDAEQLALQKPLSISRCRDYLLGSGIERNSLDEQGQVMASLFAVNDALSMTAQRDRRVTFICVVLQALIAVMALQTYGFFPLWPLLAVILLFGSGSYAAFVWGQRRRFEETYLEYRALAEGLRVQFFWHVAGIPKTVTEDFLRDQRDALEWLHLVLQYTVMRGVSHHPLLPASWVVEHWLTDQRMYFMGDKDRLKKGQAVREEARSQQFTQWMKNIFFTGLGFFTTGAAIQEDVLVFLQAEWKGMGVSILLVLASCCMSIVPAIKIYSETMALEEHARRYWRMGRYYQGRERRLSDGAMDNNSALFQRILVEAGQQALLENGDWLLLHRQRPVRVPVM